MCSPCIAMHDFCWSVHVGQAVYASLDAACSMPHVLLLLDTSPCTSIHLTDRCEGTTSFACMSFLSMHAPHCYSDCTSMHLHACTPMHTPCLPSHAFVHFEPPCNLHLGKRGSNSGGDAWGGESRCLSVCVYMLPCSYQSGFVLHPCSPTPSLLLDILT